MKSISRLLYFQPDGKHAPVRSGETLLEAAQELGVEISAVCGGVGTCGKCRVLVKEGRALLGQPTSYENNSLQAEDVVFGYRFACEAVIREDGLITVEVPAESRGGRHRLQSEGLETQVKLEPSVMSLKISVEAPSLDSPGALVDRVTQVLADRGVQIETVDHYCLASIGPTLKRLHWKCSAVVYEDHKLISLDEDSTPLLGMAVDIGTTKLAGYLLDLASGKLLTKVSRVNPQVLYGEDVMSRLTYIQEEKEGSRRLSRSIQTAVNEMIEEACTAAAVKRDCVEEIVLVGNTLMHHLMLGLEPSSLGLSPYSPVINSSYQVEGRTIGLEGGSGLVAYVLPNVAGFVGADCVGDVLATGLHVSGSNRLLVDIGTNTEMVCSSNSGLWCASSPSGPAFEGAQIRNGMRALSGAIEHVSIDRSLNLKYSTIDGAPARGICGSGVVDIVSEMARRGIVNKTGRMNEDKELTAEVRTNEGLQYIISPSSENAIGKDISFSQRDVREVQKAKAAIAAGIRTLLEEADTLARDLDQVYVAGAFGSYIDVTSAMSIGMLPVIPLYKVKQVGNAAGTGARMCLLSRQAKRAAEDVAKRMNYVELAAQPGFQQTFLKSLELAPFS